MHCLMSLNALLKMLSPVAGHAHSAVPYCLPPAVQQLAQQPRMPPSIQLHGAGQALPQRIQIHGLSGKGYRDYRDQWVVA